MEHSIHHHLQNLPAFVSVGDVVKKRKTLCILEAMKIMNEVEAEFDCKILEILVTDGSPVEYDMPILLLKNYKS